MNKRSNEEVEAASNKKFKDDEEINSVAAAANAALKYNDHKETSELNIDSQLLDHQGAFEGAGDNSQVSGHANRMIDPQPLQQLAYQNLMSQQGRDGQQSSLQHGESESPSGMGPTSPSGSKPLAGTDEWHKIRRDNHKEVERRRRENINLGIRELAGLIPSNDSNKAQVLQRAVEYIKRLKENEANNIEKWTLEKLLTDQAVAELSASNEKLKAELERAYREVEHWKKACLNKETKD